MALAESAVTQCSKSRSAIYAFIAEAGTLRNFLARVDSHSDYSPRRTVKYKYIFKSTSVQSTSTNVLEK